MLHMVRTRILYTRNRIKSNKIYTVIMPVKRAINPLPPEKVFQLHFSIYSWLLNVTHQNRPRFGGLKPMKKAPYLHTRLSNSLSVPLLHHFYKVLVEIRNRFNSFIEIKQSVVLIWRVNGIRI
ncbi:MAG: hypothetical protein ACI9GM_000722 [Salibacteraceae bacterium]|jgi:hypothetical protein